jgi:SNF2 family DNA or RNA helicase
VLIGHPGSGGIGLNLIEASYMIYYSRSFSLEHDIQSEARCYRGGSERHQSITRIDLVTPGTIDELVMKSLATKQELSDKILKEKMGEI